jgi:hypothetical protein
MLCTEQAHDVCVQNDVCFMYMPANRAKRCWEKKNNPCPAGNNNNKELWQSREKTVGLALCTYIYAYTSQFQRVDRKPPLTSTPRAFDPFPLIIIYNNVPRSTASACRPILYICYYNDVKIMYTIYVAIYIYITRIKYLI